MDEIPTVDTGRFVLRAHEPADFESYAALWRDPVVTRFIGGRAFEREEAWNRLLRYAGHWRLLGFGMWVVTDKASGSLVGEAGFHDLKRDMQPSIAGVPEAGWALLPEFHGRGAATEIVTAMLGWSDAALAGSRTVCIISPDNAASIRMAEKCGFGNALPTVYRERPTLLLERFRAA